ncbi:hypothetical protein Esti_003428 [Eimeria stiedai]
MVESARSSHCLPPSFLTFECAFLSSRRRALSPRKLNNAGKRPTTTASEQRARASSERRTPQGRGGIMSQGHLEELPVAEAVEPWEAKSPDKKAHAAAAAEAAAEIVAALKPPRPNQALAVRELRYFFLLVVVLYSVSLCTQIRKPDLHELQSEAEREEEPALAAASPREWVEHRLARPTDKPSSPRELPATSGTSARSPAPPPLDKDLVSPKPRRDTAERLRKPPGETKKGLLKPAGETHVRPSTQPKVKRRAHAPPQAAAAHKPARPSTRPSKPLGGTDVGSPKASGETHKAPFKLARETEEVLPIPPRAKSAPPSEPSEKTERAPPKIPTDTAPKKTPLEASSSPRKPVGDKNVRLPKEDRTKPRALPPSSTKAPRRQTTIETETRPFKPLGKTHEPPVKTSEDTEEPPHKFPGKADELIPIGGEAGSPASAAEGEAAVPSAAPPAAAEAAPTGPSGECAFGEEAKRIGEETQVGFRAVFTRQLRKRNLLGNSPVHNSSPSRFHEKPENIEYD